MPRRARIALPNVPVHLIQRGNNRQPCFFADEDYRRYLDWLAEYSVKSGCRVHAYVLMTNHVHLLISSDRADAGGALMKSLGQRYVQYVNRVYKEQSGTDHEFGFKTRKPGIAGLPLYCPQLPLAKKLKGQHHIAFAGSRQATKE